MKIIKINKSKLKLFISNKAFKPTATTEFFVRDALLKIKKPLDILDLGCETGVVDILISKFLKNKNKVYASDGTKLTLKIINSSSSHLSTNGAIIFSIISLSNSNKIIRNEKKKNKL